MIVEHGGNAAALAEELGYRLEDCIDFSANINPVGLSPRLRESLIGAIDGLVHYPDVHYRRSRQFLADHHQLPISSILLSNGAVEIFYELARFFCPQKVLTLSPTFMEYEKAFCQVGAQIERLSLRPPAYSWDAQSLRPALSSLSKGDLVLICNPNNPTGSLVKADVLRDLAVLLREREILLVVDEAFIDFVDEEPAHTFVPYLQDFPNSIVVRSLTKFYAIPGLRLGYALSCHTSCFEGIENSRAPWTVNSLADTVLPVILSDWDYQEKTRQWLAAEKTFLYEGLSALPGLQVLKPTVNYIFFAYSGKADLRQELWKYRIFIRSCQNYDGLDRSHYRIAVRTRRENEELLQALSAVLVKEGCDGED